MIRAEFPASLYLDLENSFDLEKLAHPEFFLSRNRDRLVCIDEVQRRPELFPLLRSLCDEWGRQWSFPDSGVSFARLEDLDGIYKKI